MIGISLETGIAISSLLFLIGLTGVLIRRNIIFLLVSVEIMLNAAGMAFVFAGSYLGMAEGQIMFLFILAVAAAGVSVGLALTILVYRKYKTLDISKLNNLRD
jgi:NADH-quinone oxidoreductase subunit K